MSTLLKTQPSKHEDLIGPTRHFMHWAACLPAAGRVLWGFDQLEAWIKGWDTGAVSERKGQFLGQDIIFLGGKGTGKDFIIWNISSSSVGWRGPCDGLPLGGDQAISNLLLKITLLVKIDTTVKLGIKPDLHHHRLVFSLTNPFPNLLPVVFSFCNLSEYGATVYPDIQVGFEGHKVIPARIAQQLTSYFPDCRFVVL